jgi:hypothetical protein
VINTLAPLYGAVLTQDIVIGHYRIHGTNTYRTNEINVSRFAKYIADDAERIAILERHCRRLGIDFAGPAVLDLLLPYRELQVVIAKLHARSYRDLGRAIGLAIETVKVGAVYPQSRWHRLLRAAWVVAVGVAPQRLAERLIGLRFSSTTRPPRLERLITAFGRSETAT